MKWGATTWTCAMLLAASAQLAVAQSAPQGAAEGRNTPGAGLASKVANAFTGPLHPVVKGVASGGGPGVGIAYDFPRLGRWRTSAETVLTVNRYWVAQINTGVETERVRVDGYARMRDMPQLAYFGPGADSRAADRTHFRLRDPLVGAAASMRVLPWVTLGGRVEQMWPDVGRGRGSRFPSIETRFDDADAPGLLRQPTFGRYGAYVEAVTDAGALGAPYQGGRTRVSYDLFDDQHLDRYTFSRVDVETRHQFTLFGPYRLLTLHGWVSTTDTAPGRDVPFFFQRALGGRGQLRSPHEELIGTDGTDATLRGFRSLRFRDRHLLLLQAEYRVPLWGPVNATVFMDAGKVTSRRDDLDLSDLRRTYGFSLGVIRGRQTLARMDVGFGGGEGVHVFWTFGRTFE